MKADSAHARTGSRPCPIPPVCPFSLLIRRLPSVLILLFFLSVLFLSADAPQAAAFPLFALAFFLCVYTLLSLLHLLQARSGGFPLPDFPPFRRFRS